MGEVAGKQRETGNGDATFLKLQGHSLEDWEYPFQTYLNETAISAITGNPSIGVNFPECG